MYHILLPSIYIIIYYHICQKSNIYIYSKFKFVIVFYELSVIKLPTNLRSGLIYWTFIIIIINNTLLYFTHEETISISMNVDINILKLCCYISSIVKS